MATYNSAGSGNFNADATWTESGQPSTDDVAVIASGHTVTMTADDAVGSIDIQGTLTTDGTARTLTLDDGGQGYICENRGTVSTTINLTINSNYAGDRLIRLNNGGNGNFNNVSITLESTSRKLTIGTEAASIDGDLTILQGEFNTDSSNNYALTVAGATSITGTLTCNASDITLGSGITNAFAVVVNGGGTFNGGTGTHIYGSLNVNSSAALYAFSAGTTTLDGKSNTERIFSTSATDRITAAGTLNIATSQTPVEIRCDDDTGINNLTMNSSSKILHLINHRGSGNSNPLVIGGNLTISAGTVTTRNVGDSLDYGLTVTKHIDITGTLTGNASAISTGTMTIRDGATLTTGGTTTVTGEDVANSPSGANWLWRQMEDDGTGFAPTAGTVHFNHASNLNGKHINESKFYNLTLTTGTGHDVAWTPKTADTLTIANDLTIAEGQFKRNVEANTLVVTADVEVHSGGILGDNDETGPNTFGSLTIASGGTYQATSGTTTITDTTGGGYGWNNAGTFTHNNGKVTFTDNLNPYIIESTFYDMEINLGQNTSELRSDDIGGAGFTILNDLTITRGRFKFNTAGDSMTVHGLTKLETNGQFGLNSPSGTHTFNGLVTVNGGTWNLSSGTNNMAGIRNVGGTIS
jgi:hypothetical protein